MGMVSGAKELIVSFVEQLRGRLRILGVNFAPDHGPGTLQQTGSAAQDFHLVRLDINLQNIWSGKEVEQQIQSHRHGGLEMPVSSGLRGTADARQVVGSARPLRDFQFTHPQFAGRGCAQDSDRGRGQFPPSDFA